MKPMFRARAAALLWLVLLHAQALAPAASQGLPRTDDPIGARLAECLNTERALTVVLGQRECLRAAYDAWNVRLDEIYRELMSSLDPESRAALEEAQARWLAFRDAEFRLHRNPWTADRGTIVTIEVDAAQAELVRQRVEALQLYRPCINTGCLDEHPR